MKFEKIKNRKRVITLKADDWYESSTGARFPVKQKPLMFFDMYKEILSKSEELVEWEKKRESGKDFDAVEYASFLEDFFARFIEIIVLITRFNGYEVDDEYIKSNMGYEDLNWYLRSVYSGTPVYSQKDLEKEQKKTVS